MDTDLHRFSTAALTGSELHGLSAGSSNPEIDKMSPELLAEILWFYRTEDPSAWNYCVLALSLAVLLLGTVLLAMNVTANSKRKATDSHSKEYRDAQAEGAEMTQAFVSLKEEGHPEADAQDLLPKVQNAGEVTVLWKDKNVTTLYGGVNEEDA